MGFYPTLRLAQSKLFYNSFCGLILNSNQRQIFKSLKFFNVVVLESIPQLIIQIFYLTNGRKKASQHISPIVFISMTFSVLSIVVSCLYQIITCLNNIKKMNNNQLFQNTIQIKGRLTIISKQLKYSQRMAHHTISGCIKDVLSTADQTKEFFINSAIINIEIYKITQQLTSFNALHCDFNIKFLFGINNSNNILDKNKNILLKVFNDIGNDNMIVNNLMRRSLKNKLKLENENEISISIQIINTTVKTTNDNNNNNNDNTNKNANVTMALASRIKSEQNAPPKPRWRNSI